MALAFGSQIHQDDLGHDALMGLQELDPRLSIFEQPVAPTSPFESSSDDFCDTTTFTQSTQRQTPNVTNSNAKAKTPVTLQVGVKHSWESKPLHRQQTCINESIRARLGSTGASRTSSTATDPSDSFSAIASESSKATSPADFDIAREVKQASLSKSPAKAKPWSKYDVRPKASIPTDMTLQEYARQCIAAAESSRLNPFSLHVEELALLRAYLSHSQVTTYLHIRNGILRLWTRNPLIAVLRDEAIGCAKDARWFEVANLCYEWLLRRGYINYGCLKNVDSQYPVPKSRGAKRKYKTIVVIGAGMSGLGCARQIEGLLAQYEDHFRKQGEDNPKVIVLEGRDRIGGRVYSRGLTTKSTQSKLKTGSRATAEMGGMIITGFDRGNPLNIIVRRQLALPYHALRPTTTLYDSNGEPVDPRRDQLAESLYNDILDRVSDFKFKNPAPKTVDGDRDLLEAGRDAPADAQKPISLIERTLLAPRKVGLSVVPEINSGIFTAGTNAVVSASIPSDGLTDKLHLEQSASVVYTAAQKARMMGWPLKSGVDDSRDLDMAPSVAAENATLGSVMDEAIRQYRDVVHILPLDLRLLNWHVANLEYSNAINYKELSLGGWDVDAGNEWEGKHTQIMGGYQQVPRGLLHCPHPLNVRKKSAVKRITYSLAGDSTSKIECEDGHLVEADYVVSTIPLGVLKRNSVEFQPPLPSWKVGAIQRVGFGVLNKIVLVYKKAFWDQSRDIFGVLQEPVHCASLNQRDYSANRGRFFQWFNCTKTSGVPTLIALMAGDAAFQTQETHDVILVAEATKVLRSVFGLAVVPEPAEAVVTRWGHDKFAFGSYSYTGPKFKPDDYEVMARPIGNLFFAGEHTCGTHPATVHGAYISGLRAASEVLEAMIGPIVIPEPLIPPKESISGLKRKSSALSTLAPQHLKLSPLEIYEDQVWKEIHARLGEPPRRPAKISANPYILFGKDNFELARAKFEDGRRPGKGKPAPNEVRIMLAKMWKEASSAEKKPYNDRATAQKDAYTAALSDYNAKALNWDLDAVAVRKEYEATHPFLRNRDENEGWDTPSRRNRRAKKLGGYAEESASDSES